MSVPPVPNNTTSAQTVLFTDSIEDENVEASLSTSSLSQPMQQSQQSLDSLLRENASLNQSLRDANLSLSKLVRQVQIQSDKIQNMQESKGELEQLFFSERVKTEQLTNQLRELQNNQGPSILDEESQNIEEAPLLNNSPPPSRIRRLGRWCRNNHKLIKAVALGGGAIACIFLLPYALPIALSIGCAVLIIDWGLG